jgi:hypothetical protein
MNEPGHMEQRAHELLNGSIDGELNAAEQDELDQLLASSDSVHDLKNELEEFVGVLDGLPELEPPQYLQNTIESQIRLPVQDETSGEKQGLFATWMPANWLRTGFALAAGAVLTVGIYQMGSEPMTARDAEQMTGTVVKNPVLDPLGLQDNVSFNTEKLSGQIELRNTGDLFTLELQLNSDGASEVIVNFADYGLKFEMITPNNVSEDAISVENGSVIVALNGKQSFTLQLQRTSGAQQTAPLELEFFSNDTLVHVAELGVNGQ